MASTYIGLQAILRRVEAGMTAGVDRSAKQLVRKAKADTPVLSGTLKGGEEAELARRVGPASVEATVHTGEAADEYAIVQHQRRRGFPFVRVPLFEHAGEHVETVAAAVAKRL